MSGEMSRPKAQSQRGVPGDADQHAPKLLILHPAAEEYRAAICSAFPELEVVANSHPHSQRAADAEIILTSTIPVQVIQSVRNLKWVQTTNSGVEFLLPAREYLQRTIVTNARGIHQDVMADYVLGMVTALHWDFPNLLRRQTAREWRMNFVGPLSGKTIGIVGLGAVGLEIAKRAKSAGLTVVGMRRGGAQAGDPVDRYVARNQLGKLLSESDFVVLVVPATEETQKLIGPAELNSMKRSAHLINVSRGSVVDECALIDALFAGKIAGAALDVFETEPLPASSKLWDMPNVLITPHIAGNPTEYPRRVLEIFLENLRRYLAGQELTNVVDLARGY